MKFDPHPMSAPTAPLSPAPFGIVAAAAVAELADSIPQAKLHGFFLAVGRRIAAAETLDGVDDASALCWRVNAFWATVGWGEAELSIESDCIVVLHRGTPQPPDGTSRDPWLHMIVAVLEGAYDSWFRRLGSGPSLHTRAEWKGDVVELRHGR